MNRSLVLFAACLLAVAAGALCVRLPRLEARPMHADEANQAMKAAMLAGIAGQTGAYRYDPREHHGPSLYWLTLPSLWLSGAKDFAQTSEFHYRIVPVVFGVGLVVFLFLVADGLGRGAALAAAVLTAVSPAMVFYSRYYVQETLLVLFTFAAIATGWRYVRTRSLGWAAAAGLSLGLMHATKETWVLAAAAMAAALVFTLLWSRWRDAVWPDLRGALRPGAILAAVAAAVAVAVALYSSFGTDWGGPADSILAYATYLRRGSAPGIHAHPWYWYLELLVAYRPARGFFWTEGLIVALAAVGVVTALGRRGCAGRVSQELLSPVGERSGEGVDCHGLFQSRPSPRPSPKGRGRLLAAAEWPPGLSRFLAFYTLTLTVLYSAIPYKTPWCMLSFLHGMILLAGVGAWAILRSSPGWPLKTLAGLLLAAGVAHLGRECYLLNFRFQADQRNPYVYAHTSTDVLNLAAQMERLARASAEGHAMVIHVVTPENYWPLPWYLRQFDPNRVGYWHDAASWWNDTRQHPPPSVILVAPELQPEVDARLRAAYNRQMIFGLRPEVLLSGYVREDLWEAFLSVQDSAAIDPQKSDVRADCLARPLVAGFGQRNTAGRKRPR